MKPVFGKDKTDGYAARLNAADFGAALLVLVFVWSFAVVFTLNFRPLYFIYIIAAGWPEAVNIPLPEIAVNYEALIEYNSIFHPGPLSFPTLDLSDHGRIHYEEVKRIFVVFQVACYASLAGLIPSSIYLFKRRRLRFVTIGAVAALIVVPAILLFFSAGDWGEFFVVFHETFFSNDYWIFDATVDPSILILPDGYFLACAVMIFAAAIAVPVTGLLLVRRFRRGDAATSRKSA
ncbi:MAG: TIGR01906 family membrane protein [Clostridiales Family XIII bacterium]|jgi:integral membrane protein (TIGR01906 family)|nr:TIGR01906 family membrane protein [Clostridiales Family XIII bacterium]